MWFPGVTCCLQFKASDWFALPAWRCSCMLISQFEQNTHKLLPKYLVFLIQREEVSGLGWVRKAESGSVAVSCFFSGLGDFLRWSSDVRNAASVTSLFLIFNMKKGKLKGNLLQLLVTLSSKRKCKCNLQIPYLHITIFKSPVVWSSVWHEDRQQYFSIWADFQTLILNACSDLSFPLGVLFP